ncbi:hypothetical protein ACFFOS_21725 [Nocardioides kongjuensis]|uniref:Apolipoprotein N-acyltransferase n=1 Tax=Nocardioides kongjuensis TaxID=349522 RepID=A0A852RSR5_9ACTN|nr:hypothetical protein [Nocardioides kongjuensis]NYD32256.1 hypothetical protein [Nocardioides kongjuensis]
MSTTPVTHPPMLDQYGVRWGVAGGTLFVGAAACTAVPLAGWSGVLTLLALTAAWSRVLPRSWAVSLAVSGWAFATGFAVHHAGRLTFAGEDLLRLALFVAVAALTAGPPGAQWRA